MLNYVLFANLYSSQGKGLNEKQTFIFNSVEEILFFSLLFGNKQPPPPNIKWSVPYGVQSSFGRSGQPLSDQSQGHGMTLNIFPNTSL